MSCATEIKRFVKWCIDNDLAFTHINAAVRAFREDEKDLEGGLATLRKMDTTDGLATLRKMDTTDGTSSSLKTRIEVQGIF